MAPERSQANVWETADWMRWTRAERHRLDVKKSDFYPVVAPGSDKRAEPLPVNLGPGPG